jgi:hypothetical protein
MPRIKLQKSRKRKLKKNRPMLNQNLLQLLQLLSRKNQKKGNLSRVSSTWKLSRQKLSTPRETKRVAVIQELTSNLDTNGIFFLKLTNPEAFSLWYGEYQKTPNEGKEKLKTNNLLNGYVKSCDGFKRAVYATYGYYGQEPDLQIRGEIMCFISLIM